MPSLTPSRVPAAQAGGRCGLSRERLYHLPYGVTVEHRKAALVTRVRRVARYGYPVGVVERVLLASPRGYCAGVERAVDTVEKALEHYGAPVYVRKQIVHNIHDVRDLEARGAIFCETAGDKITEMRMYWHRWGDKQ